MSKKEPYYDASVKKTFTSLQFTPFSGEEIESLSQVHVVNGQLYNIPDRSAKKFGALDPRLGISDKKATCVTCKLELEDCPGHFGHVRLELPVFHVGYFSSILEVAKMICKICSRILLDDPSCKKYLSLFRRKPAMDVQHKKAAHKKVLELCKKTKLCHYCGAPNGTVKKANPLRIYHQIPAPKAASASSQRNSSVASSSMKSTSAAVSAAAVNAIAATQAAAGTDASTETYVPSLRVDLNPMVLHDLFQRLVSSDLEIMDMDPVKCHPSRFIMTHLLVPPICIRPSVSGAAGTTEDDITVKITEIVRANTLLTKSVAEGAQLCVLIADWDFLQILVGLYIMGDVPGIPMSMAPAKTTRSFCARLKGKQGRFRGHLNGKRVDFSARTVISPDPNLSIEEVGVPDRVAKILTYPERVTSHNIKRLRQCILRGAETHPGANFLEITTAAQHATKIFLKFTNEDRRKELARNLKPGDVVERHLSDGDIVLFNRQPSLHKLSIMSHIARVKPWRTLRFNECVCSPYNADFDGDEMNLHLPQTEEARAEAATLMRTSMNIVTPRNGEPIIAATQDFITASYLLTHKDTFMTRAKFTQTLTFFGLLSSPATSSMVGLPTQSQASLHASMENQTGWDLHFDLPPPAILKPIALWTGKQVFSLLIKPNKRSNVMLNLGTASRSYLSSSKTKSKYELCPNDGYVLIRNSELLSGVVDRSLAGSSKESIFHALLRDYGASVCADRMSRLARLCARYLGDRGFSIGIDDVTPPKILLERKFDLIKAAYSSCEKLIHDYQANQLKAQAGSTPEQTLEAMVTKQLSDLREEASKICRDELPRHNAPMIMLTCGSKGSNINVSQMIACVAQQTVNGARIPNGFEERTLPYFARNSREPNAKGFVGNSFYSGMNPTEFFFHTMGGREGLVDTAVKVAETGYMQRRLVKALEDLCVVYDTSVRNSMGSIVQFTYGDDALDPANIEGSDFVLDLSRLWESTTNHMSMAIAQQGQQAPVYSSSSTAMTSNHDEIVQRCLECFQHWNSSLPEYVTDLYKKTVLDFLTTILSKLSQKHPFFPLCGRDVNRPCPDRCLVGTFLHESSKRYRFARVEAGTAVGALAAQSIGEPGTQMTLKTFHFAGVASMSVSLGVPRIKEIINASKNISTPIIYAELDDPQDMKTARSIQGYLEKSSLKDVAMDITEVYSPSDAYLQIRLDLERAKLLKLPINAYVVKEAILSKIGRKVIGLKLIVSDIKVLSLSTLTITISPSSPLLFKDFHGSEFYLLQRIKRTLPELPVSGFANIRRAVIRDMGKKMGYNIAAEGTDLLKLMATRGINACKTSSNHVMDMLSVLGVEAARTTIISQVREVMDAYGLKIDCRHLMLLADLMTCKGCILGITRFGLVKMRDSVLMAASFEKVTDILYDAAQHGRLDPLEGVSECIIMGKTMSLGTGLFKLLRDVPIDKNHQSFRKTIVCA